MPETFAVYQAGKLHLVQAGAEKTCCRAYKLAELELTAGVASIPMPICPACLGVLRTDWLLEDATSRK